MTVEAAPATSWHSYPQVFNLGHAAVKDIFTRPFIVQEKVDGSQFSFGRFNGELRVKSKGKEMDPTAPEKLFARAVETVAYLELRDGLTYRGEVLDKPKHNVLSYDRVPKGNVVLFDINDGEESYLATWAVEQEAARLGIEAVPTFYWAVSDPDKNDFTIGGLKAYLQHESFLGGQKVEGVVVKSLELYGTDKKRLMGKFVSEAFKESHAKVWGENRKARPDIIDRLAATLKTDARWHKAVIHLRERGELEGSPRDIPKLLREVQADVWKEERDFITTQLVSAFERDINKRLTAGLPEWWKQQLLKQQFEGVSNGS